MSTIPGVPMQKILDMEQRLAAVEAKVMPKKESEDDKEHLKQEPPPLHKDRK